MQLIFCFAEYLWHWCRVGDTKRPLSFHVLLNAFGAVGIFHVPHVQHTAAVQKLVIFNHPGWADPALMLYMFAPSGVSRDANSKIPVIGTIIKSFQNIHVPSGGRHVPTSTGPSSPLAPQSTTSLIGQRCALAPVALTYSTHQWNPSGAVTPPHVKRSDHLLGRPLQYLPSVSGLSTHLRCSYALSASAAFRNCMRVAI